MTMKKKLYITAVVTIILALSIWFIIIDFSRLVSLDFSYDIYPSAILKRINVILAVFIVWAVGKDALSSEDNRRMKAAFIFICLGEAAFVIGERVIGVAMFAVCHTILIMRNSKGIGCKLANANHKQKKRLLAAGFIALIIPAILLILPDSSLNLLLSDSLIKLNNTLIIIYIYVMLLSASLWAGLSCNILGLLPQKNSRMAAAGMVCFYCTDVLVGLDAALRVGFPWLLANNFIWFFYIPALVLLALSCYRFDQS